MLDDFMDGVGIVLRIMYWVFIVGLLIFYFVFIPKVAMMCVGLLLVTLIGGIINVIRKRLCGHG